MQVHCPHCDSYFDAWVVKPTDPCPHCGKSMDLSEPPAQLIDEDDSSPAPDETEGPDKTDEPEARDIKHTELVDPVPPREPTGKTRKAPRMTTASENTGVDAHPESTATPPPASAQPSSHKGSPAASDKTAPEETPSPADDAATQDTPPEGAPPKGAPAEGPPPEEPAPRSSQPHPPQTPEDNATAPRQPATTQPPVKPPAASPEPGTPQKQPEQPEQPVKPPPHRHRPAASPSDGGSSPPSPPRPRPWLAYVAIVALLAALAAWYLTLPGQVTFRFSPSHVSVKIDGRPMPVSNGTLAVRLPAGAHSISVTCHGWAPVKERFAVQRRDAVTRHINLKPLSGLVHVTANIEGARASLRPLNGPGTATGRIKGRSTSLTNVSLPTTIDLPMGRYRVLGQKEGFQAERVTVNVPGGRELVAAHVVFVDARAHLALRARQTTIRATVTGPDTASDTVAAQHVRRGSKPIDLVAGAYTIALADTGSPARLAPAERRVRIAPSHTAILPITLAEQLLWSAPLGGPPTGAIKLRDLNRDGTPDAVCAHHRVVSAINGRSGRTLWTFETAAPLSVSPALTDLNRDNTAEVLLMDTSANIYAISAADGAPLWHTRLDGMPLAIEVTADDLNSDRVGDYCIAAATSAGSVVHALSGKDGVPLWQCDWDQRLTGLTPVGDFTGDTIPERVVTTPDNTAIAISGAGGEPVWTHSANDTIVALCGVRRTDDGAGVIFATPDSLSLRAGVDGTVAWSVEASCGPNAALQAAQRHDRVTDAIILATDDTLTAFRTADGQRRWRFAVRGGLAGAPFTAHVNADEVPDVVAASLDGVITVIDGSDGARVWQIDTGVGLVGGPAVADLDGNHVPDVVCVGKDQMVHAFAGRPHAAVLGLHVDAEPAQVLLVRRDKDEVPDVMVYDANERLHAFSGMAGRRIAATHEDWSTARNRPLNNRRGTDSLVIDDDGKQVICRSPEGGSRWSLRTMGKVAHRPTPTTLNDDGAVDYYLCTESGWVHAVDGAAGTMLWSGYLGARNPTRVAAGDIDGDGLSDAIVATPDAGLFAFAGRDGALLWSARTLVNTVTSPALADLTGDGRIDVVVAFADGSILALDGAAWRRRDPDGVPRVPEPTCDPYTVVWHDAQIEAKGETP